MATTNALRSDRDVTSELIERIAAGELGAKLRSQVASWHQGVNHDDVEEAFQEACLIAERSCRGETEGEVFTWLRTTTHRELGHVHRRASHRELLVDVTAPGFEMTDAAAVAPDELLIDREDQVEVERVARAVLCRLSERQRQIVVLHSRGCRRSEIAEHLGITPRTVKRALEQILTAGREELVRLAGDACESGSPVVARLAFGLASPREARQAQLHLTGCARCAAVYERLDLWREKVAALLPVPVAEQADPGITERALHGAADAVSNLKQRTGESASAGREHVADATGLVKQQAVATYYRVADPTPLAGVRPGAAAAAIASCLAIGGGAAYCVERGVDPVGGIAQLVSPAREHKQAERPKKRPAQRRVSATPTATPVPITAATPTPGPAKPPPTTQLTPEPTPPPLPEEEYEPVAPATSASTATERPAPVRTPAPAPADGPGEFDGP